LKTRIARRWALAGMLLCSALGMGAAQAQCVTLSNVDTAATQDFNGLSNVAGSTTNNLTLPGWFMTEVGGGARDNEQYGVDTGASNTGDTFSYGAAGASERALGSLRSGTLIASYGACYTNNTGAAIQSLDIAYTGEQWRLGTTARTDRLDFAYSLDATSLSTGVWTDVDALDFVTPDTGTTGAKDGNAAASRTALTSNIGALSIPNGATFWIRWSDVDASGADDGLAIDDVSLTARGSGGGGTPVLTFGDQSAVEGDAGTKEFMFTMSLSQPAGPGGLTFQYSTADGTATAGIDYVAVSGASATIAEGTTSVVIGIVVNGDTVVEPNETFLINIDSAGGAIVADGQSLGTIVNDDVTITPIHDIQGNGNISPLAGQSVTTRGIVTGRRGNGFFLQTADADADADPATSQGVFVFTNSAPPADAQIGNALFVTGTVIEFVPAADPGQLSLTEITGSTLTLVSTMNPLPTPVQLTTTFPDPAGPLDQLERVEAMRVTAESFTVVAATGGNTSEPNATGSSNGQINLVVTGTPRPFREPGIQAPDPAPGGGSIPPIPRWDFNPELLFSDTDALGGPRLDLAVGTTLQNYVGPLDYGFRRFSVHQDPTVTPTVTAGPAPTAARLPTAGEFTYASYNLERFFDTVNDPAIGEPVLTAQAFDNRLAKASLGIRNFLHTPDILGVVEVENLSTLQALAARISTDAVAASQPDPQYVAYLLEGNDVGGIDVGYLVKTAEVAPGSPRVEVVGNVVQLGKDATWNDPVNGPGTLLNDRPPLLMDAVVNYADGRTFPITVIQVHQRSLNGADANDAGGDRTRTKRHLQAVFLAEQIDDMQIADPQRRIAVGGDFNAFEFNDGLTDAMGTVTGLPAPDDQTAVSGDGVDYVAQDLLNLFVEETPDQRYSFEFDGNAQSLDHVLVNQALGSAAGAVGLDHARINADFPEILRGNAGTVARLADHDPVMAYVDVASADLGVTAFAAPVSVSVGGTFSVQVSVNNTGPDAAQFPGVGFALDAELTDLSVQAPAGWTCITPSVSDGETVASCSAPSMTTGANAMFTVRATAPANEAGNFIRAVAAVDSATFDANDSNDAATAQVAVKALADLAVALNGPTSAMRGQKLTYVVQVYNQGAEPAAKPVVAVELNTSRLATRILAPNGWRCSTSARSGNVRLTCAATSDMPMAGLQSFTIEAPGQAVPLGSVVNVAASVTTTSQEQTLSNNTASRSTQLVSP
jgi:predicted extracellular nuclease